MDSEKQPLLMSNSSDATVSVSMDGGSRTRKRQDSSMIDNLEPVTLSWDKVNVYLDPPDRGFCRGPEPGVLSKHILREVQGLVKPGTLLAIIGASGSGKTTLLNTLTSRNNRSNRKMLTVGNVKVNGVDIGNGIRNISAYVQQDDLFVATMTVREHLQFRALLHMDKAISKQRRMQRVEEVIKELGLTKCADNMIGNPERMKGISGGEMRRLSFAAEVLTNPPILFCDEATSGLDSFMAENVVQTLKAMAEKGRTILCTIHQPSSEVYALFDHVLVMAEGRVAYMGETQSALQFFSSVGHPCPTNYNPADFFIMTLAVVPGREKECHERVEMICDSFAGSQYLQDMTQEQEQAVSMATKTGIIFEEALSSSSRYESSWPEQFSAVFNRCWKTNWREPVVIKVKIAQTFVIGVMISLIYLRLEVDQAGVMNINGVLFLLIADMTFTSLFPVINAFPLELPIFLREYNIGLYRVDVYFLCKIVAEQIWFIVIPVLFTAICYWMVGLYASLEAFWICAGVLTLVANVAASFGYLISASVNSVSTALAVAPPVMVPLMMFGGFFLNSETVPVYFLWAEYLSWFKYSFEMLGVNQWQNFGDISCPATNSTLQNITGVNNCQFRNGEAVLTYLNLKKDNMMLDLGLLFALLVGLRIIAFVILLVKARRSRG